MIHEKGFAAHSDITERMKVSKPTTTSMVKKLHREGYVVHERYSGPNLTMSEDETPSRNLDSPASPPWDT